MLTRRTIADIYLLSLIYDKTPEKSFVDYLLQEIKNEYLIVFRDLMEKQLEKYVIQKRVSYPLGNFHTAPLHQFPTLFLTTLHSDRKRINDRWVLLSELVVKLSFIHGKSIITVVDSINYCLHNGREFVIKKFINGTALIQMLQFKFESAQLLPYASAEVRTIFERVHRDNNVRYE